MKRYDQINMIPFIDIMLVLLAIVLTTASFVSQGLIEVNLPGAKKKNMSPAEQGVAIEISINKDNQLFFEGDNIVSTELAASLEDIDTETKIKLRVDSIAQFGGFIGVVDELKAGGYNNISIAVQAK